MKLRTRERGMTLIEVMIAIAISMVSISAFLYWALNNRVHKSKIDHGALLKEVLTSNVIEVRGRAFQDLPGLNQCLVRTYDFWGKFQSERSVAGSARDLCGVEWPDRDAIQIVWTSQSVAADEITASNGLRIQTSGDLLRRMTVYVRARNRGDIGERVEKNMTVYKR